MARLSDVAIVVCAAVFVVVLAISAYWDPTIRVLHAFEAVPYLLAAFWCWRQRKAGYLLAIAAGGLWLWLAGTRTTFVREGFVQAGILFHTGRIPRADILIAAPAALATGGLVLAAAWGYMRLRRKGLRDLLGLGVATVAVTSYFIAIFAAFTPRFLAVFPFLGR
jgi:hypothetical protein